MLLAEFNKLDTTADSGIVAILEAFGHLDPQGVFDVESEYVSRSRRAIHRVS